MADRYQNRSNPTAGAYAQDPRAHSEGDPLAELARLIGQTDPFASTARSQQPRRAEPAPAYHDEPEEEVGPAPTQPSWMQRVAQQRAQQPEPHYAEPQAEPTFDDHQDYQQVQHHDARHHDAQHQDAQAYAASGYAPQGYAPQDYPAQHYAPQDHAAQSYDAQAHAGYDAYGHAEQAYEAPAHVDPNRYDDALYGQPDDGQAYQQDQYQDDGYAYPHAGYADEEPAPKRRGGLVTVAAVIALAVVGTGGAFAYRTFVGSSRSGEPPVIKADPGPNKIIPPSANASNDSGKAMDRLAGGQERMISREEQPVNVEDASKAGGPRVVFPALNQNASPPTTASVSPSKPMVASNVGQGGDQPRRIPTITVRGDQADAGTPASRQAPARLTAPTAPANAPLSLAPRAPPTTAPARTASLNTAPQDLTPASVPASSGGITVQISSQRSESDARNSFKALQAKFPAILGSRAPLIRRADLGEKGTYYRAMVGPFGTTDEATQFCGNLKSAGGQCVVQRN